MYEKLAQFRVQFSALVDKNQTLQTDLIGSEEEKLKISKVAISACRCYRAGNAYLLCPLQALLDTKINQQTLMEKAEQEKYELVTRLLNAENDIMEVSKPIT